MLSNDDLKQISQLLRPINEKLDQQGKAIKSLKQDVERVELKVELVNSNLKKSETEIIDVVKDVANLAATQKQVDNLEERVKNLEGHTTAH